MDPYFMPTEPVYDINHDSGLFVALTNLKYGESILYLIEYGMQTPQIWEHIKASVSTGSWDAEDTRETILDQAWNHLITTYKITGVDFTKIRSDFDFTFHGAWQSPLIIIDDEDDPTIEDLINPSDDPFTWVDDNDDDIGALFANAAESLAKPWGAIYDHLSDLDSDMVDAFKSIDFTFPDILGPLESISGSIEGIFENPLNWLDDAFDWLMGKAGDFWSIQWEAVAEVVGRLSGELAPNIALVFSKIAIAAMEGFGKGVNDALENEDAVIDELKKSVTMMQKAMTNMVSGE